MPSIKLSRATRILFLKGLLAFPFSTESMGTAPTQTTTWAAEVGHPLMTGASRYLRAYGQTTIGWAASLTSRYPISATNNTSLIDLNTTAAVINFSFQGSTPDITQTWVTTVLASNHSASGLITIPAGRIVHYVALLDGPTTTANVLAWIRMSNPDTNYKYDEIGTLRIPANGYTVRFPV